jgi:hypothetical protein
MIRTNTNMNTENKYGHQCNETKKPNNNKGNNIASIIKAFNKAIYWSTKLKDKRKEIELKSNEIIRNNQENNIQQHQQVKINSFYNSNDQQIVLTKCDFCHVYSYPSHLYIHQFYQNYLNTTAITNNSNNNCNGNPYLNDIDNDNNNNNLDIFDCSLCMKYLQLTIYYKNQINSVIENTLNVDLSFQNNDNNCIDTHLKNNSLPLLNDDQVLALEHELI